MKNYVIQYIQIYNVFFIRHLLVIIFYMDSIYDFWDKSIKKIRNFLI